MGFVSGRSQYNWEHGIPCRNPQCKSYMKPGGHPNCECSASGPQTGRSGGSGPAGVPRSTSNRYAEGGEVHHCDSGLPHHESCEFYADGGDVEANAEFEANPNIAVDHSIASHGLLHALTRTGHSKSDNMHKPATDFYEHTQRGRKSMHTHLESHFDPKHKHPEPEGVTGLKEYLDSVRTNPAQLLDAPGLPGMPAHSAALGAKAAMVSNYFDGLRPTQSIPGPLSDPTPTDKLAENNYNRQLGIAEHPLSILSKVRDGTILPTDIKTLQTLYPDLAKSIQNKAFEALVNAKTSGTKIPYKHKQGLSFLFGTPLDATMTQPAMMAIMKANAGAQVESQGMPNKPHKGGATAATQKTISKVDDMYRTPLEKIQMGK